MLENQFFAAIWSDLRCKCRKCSKMGAFLGLWAQNAPKLFPRDKKWAFWVFEVSALIIDNSSLELKMLENQLFAAIWSDLRCKCRKCSKMGAFWGLGVENAQKWPPQDWKLAFWVFELSPPILENSGLELKILENVFFETIWNVFRVWSWKYSKMQRAPHRETRHWPGSWVRSTSALSRSAWERRVLF